MHQHAFATVSFITERIPVKYPHQKTVNNSLMTKWLCWLHYVVIPAYQRNWLCLKQLVVVVVELYK